MWVDLCFNEVGEVCLRFISSGANSTWEGTVVVLDVPILISLGWGPSGWIVARLFPPIRTRTESAQLAMFTMCLRK